MPKTRIVIQASKFVDKANIIKLQEEAVADSFAAWFEIDSLLMHVGYNNSTLLQMACNGEFYDRFNLREKE